MLTWLLLLVVVAGFYSFIIPGLCATHSIAAGVTYGLLASSAVMAGILACMNNPIDPNVRRFHEVGTSRIAYKAAMPSRSRSGVLTSISFSQPTFG